MPTPFLEATKARILSAKAGSGFSLGTLSGLLVVEFAGFPMVDPGFLVLWSGLSVVVDGDFSVIINGVPVVVADRAIAFEGLPTEFDGFLGMKILVLLLDVTLITTGGALVLLRVDASVVLFDSTVIFNGKAAVELDSPPFVIVPFRLLLELLKFGFIEVDNEILTVLVEFDASVVVFGFSVLLPNPQSKKDAQPFGFLVLAGLPVVVDPGISVVVVECPPGWTFVVPLFAELAIAVEAGFPLEPGGRLVEPRFLFGPGLIVDPGLPVELGGLVIESPESLDLPSPGAFVVLVEPGSLIDTDTPPLGSSVSA